MTLFYPYQVSDFELTIPLDKTVYNKGVTELSISFIYIKQHWYMSIWYEGTYLTQNQMVQPGIDLLAKFSAHQLGRLIVYGDTTSPNCFYNWPVEIGYA